MDGSTSITTKYSDRHPSALSKAEGREVPNGAKISTGEQLLSEGTGIHARITDFVGKQLTLKLDDGTTVLANTSAGAHLAIGQSADFEVLRSTGEQLLLKLLTGSNETTTGSMAGRALLAAGLPVSEENITLVNTLLDNLLPVNQDSLQTLAKDMKMFPGADPTILAQMRKHNMPINLSTIGQYEAYVNYEHKLMPKLGDLAAALDSPEIASLLEEAGFEFTEPGVAAEGSEPGAAQAPGNAVANGSALADATGSPAGLPENPALINAAGTQANTAEALESPVSQSAPLPEGAAEAGGDAAVSQAALGEAQQSSGRASLPAGSEGTQPLFAGSNAATAQSAENSSVDNSGANAANSAPSLKEAPDLARDGSGKAVVSKEAAEKFLSRWSLSPRDLSEPNAVENMYERLNNDLKTLAKALGSIKEKHPEAGAELQKLLETAGKTVENLKENLEFMNMLNRYFPYVQLPVRLKDSFTQGELYVYKRNRAKKADGNASVLLRLDMEHLGQTDVYLNLAGTNLTTKFYLGDEAASLVTEHITDLSERLEALGFNVNCEILPREEAEDPVHDFLATTGSSDTKHYRFDRKA